MDKNLAKDFKYRLGKGNLSLHVWNSIKSNINTDLPIRPSDKWSPSQVDDLKLDLQIFLNQYELLRSLTKCYPEAEEYYNLLSNWTETNNDDTVSRMKDIEKFVRLSNYPLEVQSILTFHRSYDYCPSKYRQNVIKREYINQYMSDEKYECIDYHFDPRVIRWLKNTLLFNINNMVEKDIQYKLPSCSMSLSPIGKKQYDIKCIDRIIKHTPLIEEVYTTYSHINMILEQLSLPSFELNKADSELDQAQFINNIKLLPKLNMIPNPGKMRPVFMSNDLYDLILDPLRIIVELCYKGQPCSYSSKRIYDDNYMNVDIPNLVRQCKKESLSRYNSGLVNSDLSSATDRMFFKFQENIILDVISLLSDEEIKLISSYFKIRDLAEYIKLSLRLLSHSYISYDYINDNGKQVIGLRIPKYGQCQGQRGSFALLNITHICVIIQAMYDSGVKANVNTFLVNGDDGVLPQVIIKSYNDIWINNSAEGIKSADKSTDVELPYVEFCKQYVVDENLPQPLNGLRYKSYIKILKDPVIIMILKAKFIKTDFYKSFSILRKRIKQYDSDYDYKGYITVPISDNIELRFKIYSIINELRAKYLCSLCGNPAVRSLFRSLIDDSDTPFNVFDREKWIPDKEYSSAEDWVHVYGPIPLIKKYDLDIQGLIEFDINEVIDFIVNNKMIPIEIVSLAKYDTVLYQDLVTLVQGKKRTILLESEFVRRTTELKIHVEIDKIKSHRLLIATDVVDISTKRDEGYLSSHD